MTYSLTHLSVNHEGVCRTATPGLLVILPKPKDLFMKAKHVSLLILSSAVLRGRSSQVG